MKYIKDVAAENRINHSVVYTHDGREVVTLKFKNIGWATPCIVFEEHPNGITAEARYIARRYEGMLEEWCLIDDFFVGFQHAEVIQPRHKLFDDDPDSNSKVHVKAENLSVMIAWAIERMSKAKIPFEDKNGNKMFY